VLSGRLSSSLLDSDNGKAAPTPDTCDPPTILSLALGALIQGYRTLVMILTTIRSGIFFSFFFYFFLRYYVISFFSATGGTAANARLPSHCNMMYQKPPVKAAEYVSQYTCGYSYVMYQSSVTASTLSSSRIMTPSTPLGRPRIGSKTMGLRSWYGRHSLLT
jgi:hypothetical protein